MKHLTKTELAALHALDFIKAQMWREFDGSDLQTMCREFVEAAPDHVAYERRVDALLRAGILEDKP